MRQRTMTQCKARAGAFGLLKVMFTQCKARAGALDLAIVKHDAMGDKGGRT